MTRPERRREARALERRPVAPAELPLEESLAELVGTPAGRRALSAASPVFFDTYYCGMRWATHRERWLDLFEAEFQAAKRECQKRTLLVLAPRDHGKTEAVVSFAARRIAQDRDIRVLWIGEAADSAKKRVRRIKAVLNSSRALEDWTTAPEEGCGPWIQTAADTWGASIVYVARTKESVDPTLEAVGSGGSITGGHFDLILVDDLEDDRTTFSATERAKTREWFKATVRPMLAQDGLMLIIGTRKHHDDLYGHLIANDATVRVVEDKAISVWPDSYSYVFDRDATGREVIRDVVVVGEEKARVLWPEERPLKYLLRERYAMGTILFSRELQNEVQDDAAAAFKFAWLKHAQDRGAALSLLGTEGFALPEGVTLDIVQGWDLSLTTDAKKAETADNDWTVGVTWGRDPATGDRYLLGLTRERGMTPGRLRTLVMATYERAKAAGCSVRAVAVERNAFGEVHYLGLQRTTDLPLKPHLTEGKAKADPWDGVPALSALFENGKVVLPTRTEADREVVRVLVAELWGLGREKHDDCVLALWIAETRVRKGAFVHTIAFDEDSEQSAASEEREVCCVDGDGEPQPDDGRRRDTQEEGKYLDSFWRSFR